MNDSVSLVISVGHIFYLAPRIDSGPVPIYDETGKCFAGRAFRVGVGSGQDEVPAY